MNRPRRQAHCERRDWIFSRKDAESLGRVCRKGREGTLNDTEELPAI